MGPGWPLKCFDRGFPGSFLSSGQMQIRWCFKQTEAASDLKGIHSLWALIFTLSHNQQISKTIKLHCNVFLYVCVGISLWGFFPLWSWYLKTGQSTTAVLSTVLHHVRPQIASKYNNLITTNAYILLFFVSRECPFWGLYILFEKRNELLLYMICLVWYISLFSLSKGLPHNEQGQLGKI